MAASLVFFVEVGSIANTQTFNRFGNAFISLPNKQMYVVAHQAICVHRIGLWKGAARFVASFVQPHKNLLHPDIVLCLLKDILFVDTPKHDMIYACRTSLATLTWHLRPNLITLQI